MDILFFKVYRNKVLRQKIFKKLNEQMHYFVYNYYNVPMDVMIRTNNKVLLLERLKLHERYFYNSDNSSNSNGSNSNHISDNNNNSSNISNSISVSNNSNGYSNNSRDKKQQQQQQQHHHQSNSQNEIYKYYLDFNDRRLNIFNWCELDLECFELMLKLYPVQVLAKLKSRESYHISLNALIQNCNIQLFNRIIKDQQLSNNTFKLNSPLQFNLNKCSTDQVIQTFNYIKSNNQFTITDYDIYSILNQIITYNKANELGTFFMNQLSDSEVRFSNHEISLLVRRILLNNDLDMLKIVLNKINEGYQLSTSLYSQDTIEIYGIIILKSNIQHLTLTSTSLFKSNLYEFVIAVLKYSNRDYFIQKVLIKSPQLAEYLINNSDNTKFPKSRMMFSSSCLLDDLSNKHLFEPGNLIEWRAISDISTVEKFEYLRDLSSSNSSSDSGNGGTIQFTDQDFKQAFNGDIAFMDKFIKVKKSAPSKSTLESAASLGYYDMVQHILLSNPKTYDLPTLINVLKYCHQHEPIVEIVREIALRIDKGSFTSLFDTMKYSNYFPTAYKERKQLMSALYQIPCLMEDFIKYFVNFQIAYSTNPIIAFRQINFNPQQLYTSSPHLKTLKDYQEYFPIHSFTNDMELYFTNRSLKIKRSLIRGIIDHFLFNSNKIKYETFFKVLLFFVSLNLITSDFISYFVKLAVNNNLVLVIQLVLMIGPFKNNVGGFKQLNNLSNISMSSYLNEIHYLIFYNTVQLLNNNNNNNNNNKSNSNNNSSSGGGGSSGSCTSIIQYLVSINYQYHNDHSNSFGFIRSGKNEFIERYSNLNSTIKRFLLNVGLLNLNSLYYENNNLINNHIIQFYDNSINNNNNNNNKKQPNNSNNNNNINKSNNSINNKNSINNNSNIKENFYYSSKDNNHFKLDFSFLK